jgi:hypothetical protein
MLTQHAEIPLAQTTSPGRDRPLRLALKLDAVASGALGLLGTVAAPLLETVLGIPAALLLPLGLFLVGYAVAVWLTGTRAGVSRVAVRAVIGLNVLWTVSSVASVAAGWLALTGLGVAFVLAQAAAVAVFAALQFLGLHHLGRTTGKG